MSDDDQDDDLDALKARAEDAIKALAACANCVTEMECVTRTDWARMYKAMKAADALLYPGSYRPLRQWDKAENGYDAEDYIRRGEGHVTLADFRTEARTWHYEIEHDRMDSAVKLVGWIDHLLKKSWISRFHIRAFIEFARVELGVKVDMNA